jgi:ABC-type transport system involved in cytochrome c biogenesis permease subunit
MSCINLGGRPLFGGGSVLGLYVANDAITSRKICDTLFLLANIHFALLASAATARILRGITGNRFIHSAFI